MFLMIQQLQARPNYPCPHAQMATKNQNRPQTARKWYTFCRYGLQKYRTSSKNRNTNFFRSKNAVSCADLAKKQDLSCVTAITTSSAHASLQLLRVTFAEHTRSAHCCARCTEPASFVLFHRHNTMHSGPRKPATVSRYTASWP